MPILADGRVANQVGIGMLRYPGIAYLLFLLICFDIQCSLLVSLR